MNRYLKIKGHDNWFLYLEKNQNEPDFLSDNMRSNIIDRLTHEYISTNKKYDELILKEKLIFSCNHVLNYKELANKYGNVLIRQSGSWMTLNNIEDIIEEKYDEYFPR